MWRIYLLLTISVCLIACESQPKNTLVVTVNPNITVAPVLIDISPTRTPTISLEQAKTPTESAFLDTVETPFSTQASPTISPTPSITPTPTPLVPTPQLTAHYELVVWTPELANRLIEKLQAYPDTLSMRGYHDDNYYFSYRYAALAQTEALYRFPEAVRTDWQWERAYNLAQMGDDQAGDAYATLISEALNENQINLSDLATWLITYAPSMQYTAIQMEPLSGYTNSYLLELQYHLSGAYLWLLDSPTHFEVYPLKSNWDFGFAHQAGINYTIADVTGDTVAEVITIHEHQPGGPGMLTGEFDVFDLSQTPPRKLEFDSNNPYSPYGSWSIMPDGEGANILHFERIIAYPICSATVNSNFVWNGETFILTQKLYPDIEELIDQATEEIEISCAEFAWNGMLYEAQHGNEGTLKMLENFVSRYPFSQTSFGTGEPYPPDARDKMRFQLALLRAFNGDFEIAQQQMSNIAETPVVKDSQWSKLAEGFLIAYQAEDDLLNACMATQACYPFLSIPQIIKLTSLQPFEITLDYLQQFGIPVLFTGTFDFNEDGSPEYWLLVKQENSEWIRFLILVPVEGQLQTFYVGSVETFTEPIAITSMPSKGLYAFKLQVGDDEIEFTVQLDSATNKPEIKQLYVVVSTYRETLNLLATDLLSGSDPSQIGTRIQLLRPEIEIACGVYYCHDLYFSEYLLGLAYELAGDESKAVDTYLQLWRNYPNSPYAVMAEAKLQAIP